MAQFRSPRATTKIENPSISSTNQVFKTPINLGNHFVRSVEHLKQTCEISLNEKDFSVKQKQNNNMKFIPPGSFKAIKKESRKTNESTHRIERSTTAFKKSTSNDMESSPNKPPILRHRPQSARSFNPYDISKQKIAKPETSRSSITNREEDSESDSNDEYSSEEYRQLKEERDMQSKRNCPNNATHDEKNSCFCKMSKSMEIEERKAIETLKNDIRLVYSHLTDVLESFPNDETLEISLSRYFFSSNPVQVTLAKSHLSEMLVNMLSQVFHQNIPQMKIDQSSFFPQSNRLKSSYRNKNSSSIRSCFPSFLALIHRVKVLHKEFLLSQEKKVKLTELMSEKENQLKQVNEQLLLYKDALFKKFEEKQQQGISRLQTDVLLAKLEASSFCTWNTKEGIVISSEMMEDRVVLAETIEKLKSNVTSLELKVDSFRKANEALTNENATCNRSIVELQREFAEKHLPMEKQFQGYVKEIDRLNKISRDMENENICLKEQLIQTQNEVQIKLNECTKELQKKCLDLENETKNHLITKQAFEKKELVFEDLLKKSQSTFQFEKQQISQVHQTNHHQTNVDTLKETLINKTKDLEKQVDAYHVLQNEMHDLQNTLQLSKTENEEILSKLAGTLACKQSQSKRMEEIEENLSELTKMLNMANATLILERQKNRSEMAHAKTLLEKQTTDKIDREKVLEFKLQKAREDFQRNEMDLQKKEESHCEELSRLSEQIHHLTQQTRILTQELETANYCLAERRRQFDEEKRKCEWLEKQMTQTKGLECQNEALLKKLVYLEIEMKNRVLHEENQEYRTSSFKKEQTKGVDWDSLQTKDAFGQIEKLTKEKNYVLLQLQSVSQEKKEALEQLQQVQDKYLEIQGIQSVDGRGDHLKLKMKITLLENELQLASVAHSKTIKELEDQHTNEIRKINNKHKLFLKTKKELKVQKQNLQKQAQEIHNSKECYTHKNKHLENEKQLLKQVIELIKERLSLVITLAEKHQSNLKGTCITNVVNEWCSHEKKWKKVIKDLEVKEWQLSLLKLNLETFIQETPSNILLNNSSNSNVFSICTPNLKIEESSLVKVDVENCPEKLGNVVKTEESPPILVEVESFEAALTKEMEAMKKSYEIKLANAYEELRIFRIRQNSVVVENRRQLELEQQQKQSLTQQLHEHTKELQMILENQERGELSLHERELFRKMGDLKCVKPSQGQLLALFNLRKNLMLRYQEEESMKTQKKIESMANCGSSSVNVGNRKFLG